jgi:hypothetical protein
VYFLAVQKMSSSNSTVSRAGSELDIEMWGLETQTAVFASAHVSTVLTTRWPRSSRWLRPPSGIRYSMGKQELRRLDEVLDDRKRNRIVLLDQRLKDGKGKDGCVGGRGFADWAGLRGRQGDPARGPDGL